MFSFLRKIFIKNEELIKGLKYFDEGNYNKAVEHLKEALKIDPSNDKILLSLSQALLELKQYDEALIYLNELVKNVSSINPVPLIMLGYALYNLNRLDEAEEALKKALKIDSKHPAIHYYLGLLNIKKGNIDIATDCFEEVISEKPTFLKARLLAIGELLLLKTNNNLLNDLK